MTGTTGTVTSTVTVVAQIRLRSLTSADEVGLFEMMRDPIAVRMAAFTQPDPSDRVAFAAYFAGLREEPDITAWAVDVDDQLAGMVATFHIDTDRAGFSEVGHEVSYADGIGAEVEELVFVLQ